MQRPCHRVVFPGDSEGSDFIRETESPTGPCLPPARATCPPSDGSVEPRASWARPWDPRDLHPPSPSSQKPNPRPTHPPPVGIQLRWAKFLMGMLRLWSPVDAGSSASLPLTSAHLAHPALPHIMEMLNPERSKQPLIFSLFFFPSQRKKKKTSNLPSSAPTPLVYFEPGLQNRVGEAGGK